MLNNKRNRKNNYLNFETKIEIGFVVVVVVVLRFDSQSICEYAYYIYNSTNTISVIGTVFQSYQLVENVEAKE